MKTIAQQLNVTKFPFVIKDHNGKQIYFENSKGYWSKSEYDTNGKKIYFEDSDGYWEKPEYDANGNLIYCETSDGYWIKYEYDAHGKLIYRETSYGYIEDNRPKEIIVSMDEIADNMGIPVKQLKIKK